MVEKDYLGNRIKEIEAGIADINRICSKQFENLSLDEKYSMRYQIIIIAESTGSIALHICLEEFDHKVDSYAEAIYYLEQKSIISDAETLVQIIRLRNLLVHRYWFINDSQIYDSVKNNFSSVNQFLKMVGVTYGL